MGTQPPRWEPPAERAIREAQERGEFDDLPGAGKPLRDLGDPNDPLWWVRRYAERERLDLSAALPPAIALRKEAASFPESLAGLRSEAAVREVLEDFNRRVRRDRLRPPDPGLPQVLAPTVDVEDMVQRWRALRPAGPPSPPAPPAPARRRWWWWRRPVGRGSRPSGGGPAR
jgi:hypothetical protein